MKRNPKISTDRPKKTLDSALSYLYDAIRYLKLGLMAIEFKYNGIVWRADTPQEAVDLRAALEKSTHFPPDMHEWIDEEARFWTHDRFMDVINSIGKLQHRFLAAIYEKGGINSFELTQKLELASEIALAGVISGLSKQLKQLGIEPKKVFIIDVKWNKKRKARTFILNDFFKGEGMELKWPQAWADELKEAKPPEIEIT